LVKEIEIEVREAVPKSRKADILVIDDERDISDLLSEYLNNLGYNAVPVYSGTDGLAKLEEGRYDLIITDLMMPGISGMELINIVGEKNINTRIIVMTGYEVIEPEAESIAKNVHGYIAKPFCLKEVQLIIDRVLTKEANQ
jgi:DNA-binding NtrC family response regulator